MIGSRAWCALIQRNSLYIRRHWLSTILEITLPCCFVWLIVALRNSPTVDADTGSLLVPEYYPGDETALIPISYSDYVIAIQAARVCTSRRNDKGDLEATGGFEITGLHDNGYSWQVPFVKCDSRKCQYVGQDAQPFCEYSMLVVSGSDRDDVGGHDRAAIFRNFIYDKWPVLRSDNTTRGNEGVLPFDFDFVQHFPDPSAMDEYVKRLDYGAIGVPKIAMGVVFDGNSNNEYKYALRQNSTNLNTPEQTIESQPVTTTTPPTNRIFNSFAKTDVETCTRERGSPRLGYYQNSCTGRYLYNGVIATQRLVGDFILNQTGAAEAGYFVADAGVQFAQFPQQAFTPSGFFGTVKDMAPLLITLGLLYPVASMITYLTREKELRQKEMMKMMSVLESDFEWAWFCTFAVVHMLTATCAAGVSSVLYENASWALLWLFWMLTFLAVIPFSMACATITSKSSRAVVVGLLLFFSGSFLSISVDFQAGSPSTLSVASCHPVAAFAYGIKILGYLEDLGLGLSDKTLEYSEGLSLRMLDVYRCLLVDCVLWSVVLWYLNRVIVPDYGQALPLWFPFDLSHIFAFSRSALDSATSLPTSSCTNDNIPLEPVGESLRRQAEQGKSIEIHNLRKNFGDQSAVDGLNLSIYRGQITCLLGHNGAGKSTTIGMLTGAISPTNGYATVAGRDIRTEMSEIRQDIGICLQHDCLFPELTVREHIQFFARIKGLYEKMSRIDAEAQIDQALVDVALSEKSNTFSRNLSGGMKRKLSVAMACCGSDIVFLDEPTAGMDPFSRRFTWNVIRNYKKDRIIILTTHFMDEADILGDRIAIMAEGRLRCVGSSLFLKKAYGVGYQLTIDRGQECIRRCGDDVRKTVEEVSSDTESNCDESVELMNVPSQDSDLKRLVTESVHNATLLSEVGSELSYQLPLNSASSFGPMFAELDKQVDANSISCYGVSITTLTEVFHLVTKGQSQKSDRAIEGKCNEVRHETLRSVDMNYSEDGTDLESLRSKQSFELEDEGLFGRHVVALLKKRGSHFCRDKKAWMCTAIVPSLFVLIGFLVFAFVVPNRNMPPLKLKLEDYNSELLSNPISFNSPSNPFLCQPGVCSHREAFVKTGLTDEAYAFCGYEAKLGISQNGYSPSKAFCSVSESLDVVSRISPEQTSPDQVDVSTVFEGSLYLLEFADAYASSRYGAVWFSHFHDSKMGAGSYRESAVAQCEMASMSLNYSTECSRFGGVGYVVQYNYTAIHSALLYESLANEALVQLATNNSDFVVEVTIAPLPVTHIENTIGAPENAFLVWFLVVVGFPFIGGAFGSFVVQEKCSKAKHLQTVAGVHPSAYWLSTFLWDTLNYQIPLWIVVAQMFIFDVDILTTSKRDIFSGILTILFLFGPALAGFTYCLSFAFNSASMCNVFVISGGFLIGLGGPLTCTVLMLLASDPTTPNPILNNAADVLTWILRFTPFFCFGKGLFYAINIDLFIFLEGDDSLSAWTEPVMLYEIYFLAAQAILFPLLAVQLDLWSTNPHAMTIWRKCVGCFTFRWLRASKAKSGASETPADDDVAAEEKLVLSGNYEADTIAIRKLSKVYDDGKLAVDSLSLGIAPGECFGLLGINGAGKTTTMGLLTAEFPPTSGDAILGGFSVMHEPQKIRRRIGYCPQFDALYSCLTAREHLHLYGAIKGIPNDQLADAATRKLMEVGLKTTDWDRVCSGFSGGMKRRLSLACATMGQPQIVFLDEMSTGVDPVSRQEIWQLVSDMVAGEGLAPHEKPSVILTTHSMEECEALCPRIGIMANGRLQCIGSAQHLKTKFGRGYQIEMNVEIVKRDDADFIEISQSLSEIVEKMGIENQCGLGVEQCSTALNRLTGDDSLSSLICANNAAGFLIWKDGSSPLGVSLESLSMFATGETRVLNVEKFVKETFPEYVLRERQDTKTRFEVNGKNIRISKIFTSVEERMKRLRLADYGISQTSLEQVFNLHAAEAERVKEGKL